MIENKKKVFDVLLNNTGIQEGDVIKDGFSIGLDIEDIFDFLSLKY